MKKKILNIDEVSGEIIEYSGVIHNYIFDEIIKKEQFMGVEIKTKKRK